ncbi:hypothetical protein N665_0271s0029 [Sinapis alba]|nr:hypothetical protein N665_0271s0029 [Sinapis alba]
MIKLCRGSEYSIDDVRKCLHASPGSLSSKESRYIYKHARLRKLIKSHIRTLRRYKEEMYVCLKNGNKEAHYIEGIKQFFALHDRRKGMRHLKLSAKDHYAKGNYLYGIHKLLVGDHAEGMNHLDIHTWRNNTYNADKIWRQVKQTLCDVPIIEKRSYGINMMLIMPPRSCNLTELDKRCTTCFYYKQMEKFMQLIYSG